MQLWYNIQKHVNIQKKENVDETKRLYTKDRTSRIRSWNISTYPSYKCRGGVSDNATLERIVGHSEIANLGNSLTEIVGNEPLETTAKTLSGGMNELKKSVSDGKSSIASAITAQGVATASDATFNTMAENITKISTGKYNEGRTQGQTDVITLPNSYNLYTKDQYDANYTSGYNNGVNSISKSVQASLQENSKSNENATFQYAKNLDTGTYILTVVGVCDTNGGTPMQPVIGISGNFTATILMQQEIYHSGENTYGNLRMYMRTYKLSVPSTCTMNLSIAVYSGATGQLISGLNGNVGGYQLTKISNNAF